MSEPKTTDARPTFDDEGNLAAILGDIAREARDTLLRRLARALPGELDRLESLADHPLLEAVDEMTRQAERYRDELDALRSKLDTVEGLADEVAQLDPDERREVAEQVEGIEPRPCTTHSDRRAIGE